MNTGFITRALTHIHSPSEYYTLVVLCVRTYTFPTVLIAILIETDLLKQKLVD